MAYYGPLRDLLPKLEKRAEQLAQLSAIPDRVTANDLRDAADAFRTAGEALKHLMNDQLPGCVCRFVGRDDGGGYLVYSEDCRDHGRLWHLEQEMKKRRETFEKALKNEVRLQLIGHILSGAATSIYPNQHLNTARNAKALAEAAISILLEPE